MKTQILDWFLQIIWFRIDFSPIFYRNVFFMRKIAAKPWKSFLCKLRLQKLSKVEPVKYFTGRHSRMRSSYRSRHRGFKWHSNHCQEQNDTKSLFDLLVPFKERIVLGQTLSNNPCNNNRVLLIVLWLMYLVWFNLQNKVICPDKLIMLPYFLSDGEISYHWMKVLSKNYKWRSWRRRWRTYNSPNHKSV